MLKASDPNYLRILIEESVKEAHRKLAVMARQVERYVGPFWDGKGQEADSEEAYSPENTYFEYLSAMVPRLVFRNPRVRVSSRRIGPQQDVADAVRHGLNRIVRDQHLDVTLRDLAVDMLFSWGVALVKEEPREGVVLAEDDPIYPANPTWPKVERVPQHKFFVDKEAYSMDTARFRGHEWRMDKDDLIERAKEHPEEGWNLAEIDNLATDDDETSQYFHGLPHERHDGARTARQQVHCYDVWFPEIELEDSPGKGQGFYGTIYTIAVRQANTTGGLLYDADGEKMPPTAPTAGFIRKPRPFYGPRTGPYTVFGCYYVPDSVFPLSPLVATEGQIMDLNDQVSAATRAMQRYKKMIGVPSAAAAAKIKNNPDGYVVQLPFEMGKPQFAEMEIGGHSDRQLEHMQITKERVDRTLGMDETMRGNTSGGATATEHTLANESAMARMSEIKESFTKATVNLLESMAHYMYYSDTVVFPMGDEVLEAYDIKSPEGQSIQPWYRGGEEDHGSGYSFYDLELEIEPYSMERSSEGMVQQRAIQRHELVTGSLEYMERFPDFPWKQHFKDMGDSLNQPNMDALVPEEMLNRLAEQMSMMMQLQVQAQTETVPDARFAYQLGQGGSSASAPSQYGPPTSKAAAGGGPPTAQRTQGQGFPGQMGKTAGATQ
jgi:hypothetical protein